VKSSKPSVTPFGQMMQEFSGSLGQQYNSSISAIAQSSDPDNNLLLLLSASVMTGKGQLIVH
jgi:hypothetical protein